MIVMPRAWCTERLHLRPLGVTDVRALFQLASDAMVTRFLDWPAHTALDDTYAFIDDVRWGWESGEDYCYAIEHRQHGTLMGTVACQFDEHGAQLGYVLDRAYWGAGYATEAAAAVRDAALELPAIHRFWATCDIDNRASARVLEKLGMIREGVLRRWSERPNHDGDPGPRDAAVYAWVR